MSSTEERGAPAARRVGVTDEPPGCVYLFASGVNWIGQVDGFRGLRYRGVV